MSRQQRGGGSEVARGAGYAAFLGALLIGVAVVIGIVLLQIGDTNDNGPASAGTRPKPTTTTRPKTTTTRKGTPTATTPLRAPSEVKYIVLNGGAASGKAADMAGFLKTQGYTNVSKSNDWAGHDQKGNSVYCRAGFEREGPALAVHVGSGTSLKIPYPTPAPPYSGDKDCVVVVGST